MNNNDDYHDLVRAMERLNQNISSVFGSGNTVKGKNKKSDNHKDDGKSFSNSLKGATKQMTDSMRVLSGTTDDFHHFLRNLIGFGAAGEVFELLVRSGEKLYDSYTKMANMGQTFGRSMFSMAAAAGASGVTLDEFTRSIEKNGAVAAVLQSHTTGTSSAFMDLTKGVRDSLKQVGFYGMTVSQVDDATGDYLDTLNRAGNLTKLSDQQRISAVNNMIESATRFSTAFGKNRDELLKQTKAATDDPDVTARFAGKPVQQQAYTLAVQGMTAMSSVLGDSFHQMERGGANFMFNNIDKIPLVKSLQQIGGIDLAFPFQKFGQMIEAGKKIPDDDMVDYAQKITQYVDSNKDRLDAYQAGGGEQAESVTKIRELAEQLRPFVNNIDKTKKMLHEAGKPATDLDNAILNFSNSLHGLTGTFQKGFFSSFVEGISSMSDDDAFSNDGPGGIGGGKTKAQRINELMENLSKGLEAIGSAFGELLAKVFTPANMQSLVDNALAFTNFVKENIPDILDALKGAFDVISGVAKDIIPPAVQLLKVLFGTFTTVVGGIRDSLVKTFGMSKGWADIAVVGIGVILKKVLGNIFKSYFQTGYFYIKNAEGLGGGLGGGGGGGSGGGGGLGGVVSGAPAKPTSFRESWKAGGVRGVGGNMLSRVIGKGGFLRSMHGAVLGMITGAVATGLIEHFGSSAGLPDSVTSVLAPIGGIVAGMFGPMLLSSVGSTIAGAIGPAISTLLAPELLIPAVLAAGIGYIIWQGNKDIKKHLADGTWFQDKLTGAVNELPAGMEQADNGLIVPKAPMMPNSPNMPATMGGLNDLEVQDKAKRDQDQLKLNSGTLSSADAASVNADLLKVLKEIKDINLAQAALQKRNNDIAKDATKTMLPGIIPYSP